MFFLFVLVHDIIKCKKKLLILNHLSTYMYFEIYIVLKQKTKKTLFVIEKHLKITRSLT